MSQSEEVQGSKGLGCDKVRVGPLDPAPEGSQGELPGREPQEVGEGGAWWSVLQIVPSSMAGRGSLDMADARGPSWRVANGMGSWAGGCPVGKGCMSDRW